MCLAESPGSVLREHMHARNMRIRHLGKLSGISRGTIDKILCGRGRISPATAAKLALAFQTAPSFWMRVQYEYTLSLMIQRENAEALPEQPEDDEGGLSDEELKELLSGFMEQLNKRTQWMRR